MTGGAAQRWRVTIIDDNPDDRADVRRLLLQGSSRHYDFVDAETGGAGVRAVLEGETPTCVILDYQLPDSDALEVLALLTTSAQTLVCPVVVLTGSAGHERGRAALRAGAHDFVGKSWLSSASLTRTVENAVERWAMTLELQAQQVRIQAALDETMRATTLLQARESELHIALESAQRAVRVREQLMSVVSHDLKTPLNTLLLGISVLKDMGVERAPDVLLRMTRQAHRMESMIDDLLDSAQLQAGKHLELNLGEVDLVQLLNGAVDEHRDTAHHHRIEIRSAPGALHGVWDAKRIERVINNLLSNAVKYSPAGGDVRITLESTQLEGRASAVLCVEDEGIGISDQERPNIFDWYTRAENARGAFKGSGVGLAAAREIVEQHGGSISVASAVGKGSTFTVSLPTSPSAQRRIAQRETAYGEPTGSEPAAR